MTTNSYFDSRFSFDKNRKTVWEIIGSYLQKEIPPQARILEIGAGYCDFINNIHASERHALDIAEVIKEYANKDVTVHVQNSREMKELETDYFDTVFASNFFEHLTMEELKDTLLEVRRILKEEGKLIIIQPNFKYAYREYFDDYTHQLVFTHVGFSDILKAYQFVVEKVIPKFLPFSMKSSLPKFPFLVKLYLYSPIKPFARQMLIIAKKKEMGQNEEI